jgi:hypothetical protein
MTETVLIRIVPSLMKIVHIELTYERTKVIMFEVPWKNFFCKFIGLLDYKSILIFVPTYDVI